jgi:hypothetical protein
LGSQSTIGVSASDPVGNERLLAVSKGAVAVSQDGTCCTGSSCHIGRPNDARGGWLILIGLAILALRPVARRLGKHVSPSCVVTATFYVLMTGMTGGTAIAQICPGDCNEDREVSAGELIRAVHIALGSRPLSICPNADKDGDGSVSIGDLVAAVSSSLFACGTLPTLTRTRTPTRTLTPVFTRTRTSTPAA